jgi:tetraacyldisaccharide 4'-kinase
MIKSMFSKIYGKFVNKRNEKYDNSEKELIRLKVPVLSVGNLTVGGTGKTPFVQMLGKIVFSLRKTPGIIGRGYKRNSKGEIIISDGKKILTDAETGGDEMILLAETLSCPIIAHDDKAAGAKSLTEKFNVDAVIIDDGYQHRKLHRDLDVVLVDKDTIENPNLIPEGRLREPLESLNRADIICLTGDAEINDNFKSFLKEDAIIMQVVPVPGKPYKINNPKICSDKEIHYVKKGVVAFAGIAKPERFYSMLDNLRFNIKETIDFDDHHKYSEKDVAKLIETAKKHEINKIATTEKDLSKLRKYQDMLKSNGIDCYVFPIKLKITKGKNPFFNKINEVFFPKKSN